MKDVSDVRDASLSALDKLIEGQHEAVQVDAARRIILQAARRAIEAGQELPRVILDAESIRALHGDREHVTDNAERFFGMKLRDALKNGASVSVPIGRGTYTFAMALNEGASSRGKSVIDFSLTAQGTTRAHSAANEKTLLELMPLEEVISEARAAIPRASGLPTKIEGIRREKRGLRWVFVVLLAVGCGAGGYLFAIRGYGERIRLGWTGSSFTTPGGERRHVTIDAKPEPGTGFRSELTSDEKGGGGYRVTEVVGKNDRYGKGQFFATDDGYQVGIDWGESGKWFRPQVMVWDARLKGRGAASATFHVMICGIRYDLPRIVSLRSEPAEGNFGFTVYGAELPVELTCVQGAAKSCRFFASAGEKTVMLKELPLGPG